MLQRILNMGVDSNNQGAVQESDTGHPVTHAHDDVNISEEVSKTGIWHHLNSQPTLAAASADVSQPRHRFASSVSHAVM